EHHLDKPPFKPASPGSTSDAVEASKTARRGEMVLANDTSVVNTYALRRPAPSKPWIQQNTYGGAIIDEDDQTDTHG
nr:peroxisomal membrane protein 13 [Tanacetum cinerariifolium]